MVEIRADVTEAGWDTIAFVEAIWPSARANASLLTTAPELLEALQMLLSSLSPSKLLPLLTGQGFCPNAWNAARRHARAIIANATKR